MDRPAFCCICGQPYIPGRDMTCSDVCHEALISRIIAQVGEFEKVVRASTGEAFKVPTRDILEKGVEECELDQYPEVEHTDVKSLWHLLTAAWK